MGTKHVPVLLQKIIEKIDPKPLGIYIDTTLGGGGHTYGIINKVLKKHGDLITIVCFDRDQSAIENFSKRIQEDGFELDGKEQYKKEYKKENVVVILVNKNFESLKKTLQQLNIKKVNGIIADLGISTDQLEDHTRGFSYKLDAQLDLRMDTELQVCGADLLNGLYEKELIKILIDFGDLGAEAKRIAQEIVAFRKMQKIQTMEDLLIIINKAVNLTGSRNLAARVVQAIRIVVNRELDSLKSFLPQSLEALDDKGRIAVISFHSGEDRIVKNSFKEWEKKKFGNMDYITPTEQEILKNPKASSAKLRVFSKK